MRRVRAAREKKERKKSRPKNWLSTEAQRGPDFPQRITNRDSRFAFMYLHFLVLQIKNGARSQRRNAIVVSGFKRAIQKEVKEKEKRTAHAIQRQSDKNSHFRRNLR